MPKPTVPLDTVTPPLPVMVPTKSSVDAEPGVLDTVMAFVPRLMAVATLTNPLVASLMIEGAAPPKISALPSTSTPAAFDPKSNWLSERPPRMLLVETRLVVAPNCTTVVSEPTGTPVDQLSALFHSPLSDPVQTNVSARAVSARADSEKAPAATRRKRVRSAKRDKPPRHKLFGRMEMQALTKAGTVNCHPALRTAKITPYPNFSGRAGPSRWAPPWTLAA